MLAIAGNRGEAKLISRIKGTIRELGPEKVYVEVNGLTYEVMVPSGIIDSCRRQGEGQQLELYTIYFIEGANVGNQFPRLVGFSDPVQRDFFTLLTSVSGLGVRKALRSLVLPINEIARAIETENAKKLTELPGIGPRMAEKIIAELRGKVARFALLRDSIPLAGPPSPPDFASEALQVLQQLQYKPAEAKALIDRALATGKHFKSAEELLQQVFKQTQGSWQTGQQSESAAR